MSSSTAKFFDKEIVVTKKPINYYVTMVLVAALFITLAAIILMNDIEFRDGLLVFFIFVLLAWVAYANFGRYLAVIILYHHRIEINYLFPWNKSLLFEFDSLQELDYKDIPSLVQHRERWYAGGKWLYLKNEKGEVCQFKYNINNSDDKLLVAELKKRVESF